MKSFSFPARFLQAAAFLAAPLSVVAPRALAVLLPVAALGAGLSAWQRRELGVPPPGPTLILIAALAWGGASAAWALEPRLVWSVWFQIAALALAGLVVLQVAMKSGDDAQRIGLALGLGVALAVALLAVEWVSAHLLGRSLTAMLYPRRAFEPFVFNRGAATIAILVWPAAIGIRWRWGAPAAATLVIATLIVVAQYQSMAAIVGLVAGAVVYVLASWRPVATAHALAALLVVGAVAAPILPRLDAVERLIAHSEGSISISHRLQIWRFVADAVAERPVAGWGLNASRDLPGGIDEVSPGARRLPLHPHNGMLQWWLELGAVGAALGTGLVVLTILGAGRLGTAGPVRAGALAATAGAIVVALTGYGIWQAWWMAVLWLAAGFTAAIGASRR